MHGHGVLEIVIIFLAAAVIAVPLSRKLGLGAVLGYLCAGVIIGPQALGLVADAEQTLAASEFGVVLMLFIIGLELSPARLWVMRRLVFGFGAMQVLVSALLLGSVLLWLGIDWRAAVIIGLGLALSSTAVGLQLLAERKEMTAPHGRLGFGILLFQDLAAIPLLATIPLLGVAGAANEGDAGAGALRALLAIAALVIGGRYLLRPVFRVVARSGAVEVFTATALLVVVASAWLMQQAGLSMGLGAFLAGLLLADSEFRHELESQIDPFRGLLLGLFFIAVGMSIDLHLLLQSPLPVLGAVAALLLLKSAVLITAARISRMSRRHMLLLAAALSMGGEFAFVVFAEAGKAGLIPLELRNQLNLVVGLSMAIAPLLLFAVDRWVRDTRPKDDRPADTIDHEHPQVIIAGFGRVGQIVARMLRANGIPFTALEHSAEQVDVSRRFGSQIYYGDPSRPDLLRAAHADRAKVFVLATDDPETNIRTARLVRRMFPHLRIVARVRNRQHAFRLMDMSVESVVRETFFSSLFMAKEVLKMLGVPEDVANERSRVFAEHDRKLLAEQHLVYDDEAALIPTSREAFNDLDRLFAADTVDDVEDIGEAASGNSDDASAAGGDQSA